ncbi:CAPN13, partial [Symbiodinium microadriaticum]
EPVSPALQVVRAARPVLRGVQWLANRVLGERPANLGCSSCLKIVTCLSVAWTGCIESDLARPKLRDLGTSRSLARQWGR